MCGECVGNCVIGEVGEVGEGFRGERGTRGRRRRRGVCGEVCDDG